MGRVVEFNTEREAGQLEQVRTPPALRTLPHPQCEYSRPTLQASFSAPAPLPAPAAMSPPLQGGYPLLRRRPHQSEKIRAPSANTHVHTPAHCPPPLPCPHPCTGGHQLLRYPPCWTAILLTPLSTPSFTTATTPTSGRYALLMCRLRQSEDRRPSTIPKNALAYRTPATNSNRDTKLDQRSPQASRDTDHKDREIKKETEITDKNTHPTETNSEINT